MTDPETVKPSPLPDEASAPYWDGAKEHRLVLQKCDDCGAVQHPADFFCHTCRSEELGTEETGGEGTIVTFVVFPRAEIPAFEDETPLILALVRPLEHEVLIFSKVAADPDDVSLGSRVRVAWEDRAGGATLPFFELTGESADVEA